MAGAANTKSYILVLAALLGIVTGILVMTYLRNAKQSGAQAQVQVVAAKVAIPKGTQIQPDMVELTSIPSDQAASYESSMDRATSSRAIADIPEGPLPVESLVPGGIPEGYRAVTVGVDEVIGVAGLIRPGSRVDVVATYKGQERGSANVVLQNVEVLAAGRRVDERRMEGAEGPTAANAESTVTLLVTPDQAARLVLAESEGKLRLLLRGAGDGRVTPVANSVSDVPSGSSPEVRVTAQAPSGPAPSNSAQRPDFSAPAFTGTTTVAAASPAAATGNTSAVQPAFPRLRPVMVFYGANAKEVLVPVTR